MVAFIDPRRSKVDIAQATGRAMRQSKETGKTTGYVIVPLFLEQHKGESEEEALKRSGFEDVALVVAAMEEQDDDLVDIVRQLRTEKGEGKPFRPRRLIDKVEVIAPSVALQSLRRAIAIAVVDTLGRSWDEMFGRLTRYTKQHGDCLVPATHRTDDGYNLGGWVHHQRIHGGGTQPTAPGAGARPRCAQVVLASADLSSIDLPVTVPLSDRLVSHDRVSFAQCRQS